MCEKVCIFQSRESCFCQSDSPRLPLSLTLSLTLLLTVSRSLSEGKQSGWKYWCHFRPTRSNTQAGGEGGTNLASALERSAKPINTQLWRASKKEKVSLFFQEQRRLWLWAKRVVIPDVSAYACNYDSTCFPPHTPPPRTKIPPSTQPHTSSLLLPETSAPSFLLSRAWWQSVHSRLSEVCSHRPLLPYQHRNYLPPGCSETCLEFSPTLSTIKHIPKLMWWSICKGRHKAKWNFTTLRHAS